MIRGRKEDRWTVDAVQIGKNPSRPEYVSTNKSFPLSHMKSCFFFLPFAALVLSQLPTVTPSLHVPVSWDRTVKELVRLSSQGFQLVILPFGIHTTLLPPEAACVLTARRRLPIVILTLALVSPSSLGPRLHLFPPVFSLYSLWSFLLSIPRASPPPVFSAGPFDTVCLF